jgi:hypothetical protein
MQHAFYFILFEKVKQRGRKLHSRTKAIFHTTIISQGHIEYEIKAKCKCVPCERERESELYVAL